MKNGWVDYIDIERYHEGPGLSKTSMATILDCPARFLDPPTPPTEAMEFGNLIHPAVLEPDVFAGYKTYPDDCLVGSGEGQRGRKKAFELEAKEEEWTVLKPDQLEQINAMRDAVLLHPDVKELGLLEDGEAELTGYYSDPEFDNVLTKIRLDYINKSNRRITDLKSTADATEYKFQKVAYDKKYTLQSGHYLYTTTQLTEIIHDEFYFIAVERPKIKGQYVGVMIYKATEEFINYGLVQRARALRIYNDCVKSGIWPGYSTEMQDLNLPSWVKRKEGMVIHD